MSVKDNLYVILACLSIIGFVAYGISYKSTTHDVTITVIKKERLAKGDVSKYLVYAKDGVIYENSDSWLFWKFNSVNIQHQLKVGKTYKVKVAGWRVEVGTHFPNIVEIYSNDKLLESEIDELINELKD